MHTKPYTKHTRSLLIATKVQQCLTLTIQTNYPKLIHTITHPQHLYQTIIHLHFTHTHAYGSCSLGQLATMHTYALTKLTTTRASCCHRHILLCIVQKTKSSHTLWLRIKKNYSYTFKQMELARKIGESAGPVPSELFLQTVIHNSHININLCSLQRARTAHKRLPWKNELEWRHIQHHGPNQAILK